MDARYRPSESDTAARVFLLIDSQPIYHRGVQSIVANEPSLVCVGDAGSCQDALEQAPSLRPDVVLADAGLVQGPEAATLQRQLPGARFVVLVDTAQGDPEDADLGVAPAERLPKSVSAQDLIDALVRTQPMPAPAPAHSPAALEASNVGASLTRRERDLLALMARGLSNSAIARELAIAMPTVKFHVANIMGKLNAENRTSAVLTALRHKLVVLS